MEAKLKHLEFIQAAISRMATNSFLFKGWAITIAAALSAFGAVKSEQALFAIALVTTVLFWALDGYYLWLERGFIALHKHVSEKEEADIDFSMQIDKSDAVGKWLTTCARPHLMAFYGIMLAVDAIGIFMVEGG